MEVKDGVAVEMDPEEPTIIGGSLNKVQVLRAGTGTVTVTGLALDVGVSQAEPTPAAATPGQGVEDQILQTRALKTQAPTGVTRSTSPILTPRPGVSQ